MSSARSKGESMAGSGWPAEAALGAALPALDSPRATVGDLGDVGRLVYLAFHKTADDVQALADELFRAGRRTAEEAILREAQRAGCGVVQVALSTGSLLSWVRERADWAARSIADTYNADLVNEIVQVLQRIPTANRWVLSYHLQLWEAQRQGWKSSQVAVTEAFTIEHEAKMRYEQMNAVKEAEYWFGYSLQCEVCQKIARGNPHTRAYAERVGLPHVNCLDHWHVVGGEYVDCANLWLGE